VNPAKLARQLNEGAAFHQSGDLDKAERVYRAVLKQVPKQPDALHLLGVLLDQRGERAKGIAFVRQALAVQSAFPDAHFNLGRMLAAEGDVAAARQHYQSTLAFKPGHAPAHNGLGLLHGAQGNFAEAIAAFERAIRFDPRFLNAYLNLCSTYRDSRREADILKVADQALAVDPNNAQLILYRSEAEFMVGRLADGWRDYEWRFLTPQRTVEKQPYALPFWKGEDLASKGILIWCEQGIGDEIIFSSMVPGIAARARRCVVQTTPRLAPLFKRSFPNAEVFGTAVPADVAAALDVQISMGSAGQWARPSFASFPATAGYLKADPAQSAALRSKYKSRNERNLLVGLSWKSVHIFDAAQKTVDLDQWGAVLGVPGVTFVNLQYGDNRDAIASARAAFGADIVEDPEIDSLIDLDSYAAQVAAMDMVITSSNSAAHVAGALGVPTFCMIPRALGSGRRWYWFGDGAHSPWYRAMTLFRQTQGTWAEIMSEVGLALAEIVGCAGAGATAAPPLREQAMLKLKQGATDEALGLIEKALAQEPKAAELHNMHGMTLARLGRLPDAVDAYTAAIQHAPRQAEVHNNLGTALRRMGRAVAASKAYTQAHHLKPDHPSIFLNYAMALFELDQLDAALDAMNKLVALQPEYVDAHYNRALILMSMGKLGEGWDAFKWRLKRPDVHVRHADFPQPVWAGEALTGKHVLVWTDLGLGEEILTASLIPDLKAAARKVTLLCSERLVNLFQRSFPGAAVAVRKSPLPAPALAPDIDAQMSLAELGAAFRPDFAAFKPSPYLTADAGAVRKLRQKYLHFGNPLIVGISWSSTHPGIGAQKSAALAEWLPLLKVPGVTFVSLQYGDCRAEIEELRRQHGISIIHDTDIDLQGDMDLPAAQIAAMDHVITISNTAAHLSGALGIPTWILLPQGQARLWYWFRGLESCAWYPNARLLRSPEEQGWQSLMTLCAEDLQRWTKGTRMAALLKPAREAHRAGDNAAALAAVSQVLQQSPSAEAWNLQGDILLALGEFSAAAEAYGHAVDLQPYHPGHIHDLGRSLLQAGRMSEAETALARAAALSPSWAVLCDLGTAQLEQGRTTAALESYTRAVAAGPEAGLAHFNLGNALQDLGRLNEAEAAYRAAVHFTPDLLPAWVALATLAGDLDRRAEADELFMKAKALAPASALFSQAYALMKLRFGALHEGFSAYDWRFEASRYALPKRPFAAPWWNGEPLAGRDILIWTEQGLGDEILSAGMFAEVIAQARSCTIECSERVAPLLKRSFGAARVIARRDPPDPLVCGPFDFQTPALSLAKHLRQDFSAFPGQASYLKADEGLRDRLRSKYRSRDQNALVVGISWDSTGRHGTRKRLPLEAWEPLFKIPGVTFVALQYGITADDPAIRGSGLKDRLIVDGEIDARASLDQSAAQVAAMDLVITVSNTTAHLAGAQGVAVWALLPSGPGCLWYWFRDRTESPWYPSMRIFRQQTPGDWQPVVDKVARALVEMKAPLR